MWKKIGYFLNDLESRWSLWTLVNGAFLALSGVLPAWAVKSAQIFVYYEPLSWVLAGFAGLFFWAILRLTWIWGKQKTVRAKYDARMLERGDPINPLDLTFEGKRIFINDFALPSHTLIHNKTFINCEIIGPANIYFLQDNLAAPILPPIVDGVWLAPDIKFHNGFTFSHCIFRNCSFQRITIFAGIENYLDWKDNPNVNWIGLPPTQADIDKRMAIITPPSAQQVLPSSNSSATTTAPDVT